MKKTNKNALKPRDWARMSSKQLRDATAIYDDPDFVPPVVRPPAALEARHAQARRALKRGRGRARVGLGAKRLTVTVEGGLLQAADEFAKRSHVTRAELVASGLRAILAGKIHV